VGHLNRCTDGTEEACHIVAEYKINGDPEILGERLILADPGELALFQTADVVGDKFGLMGQLRLGQAQTGA
jgi:hypothetical protein